MPLSEKGVFFQSAETPEHLRRFREPLVLLGFSLEIGDNILKEFEKYTCERILSTKSRGYWEYKKFRKSTPIMRCQLF